MIPDLDFEYPEYHPRYYANCARCGDRHFKSRMLSLYVKDGAYDSSRVLCHICQKCMPGVLDFLDVAMPQKQKTQKRFQSAAEEFFLKGLEQEAQERQETKEV